MVDSRRSTRRSFLKGRAAADALADAASAALAPAEAWEPIEPHVGQMVQFSRAAMASQFELLVGAEPNPRVAAAAAAALERLDALEDQLSVFREQSEVSRINRMAALAPVTVEPGLFGLLRLALEIHRTTAGAYDITASPLWEAWGFRRRAGRLPSQAEIAAALARVGSDHLLLDEAARTIRFRVPGVQINLGSIGKGYALDRCAESLAAEDVSDFLLHGGQSSVLARGNAPGERGWTIGVPHPLRRERRLGTLRLVNRALATSGSASQYFLHQGQRYGHILDPRSGWPAQGVLSVTALAATAAEADALSTAFYVMGPTATAAWCAARPDVAALLQLPGQRSGDVELALVNLQPEEWAAAG